MSNEVILDALKEMDGVTPRSDLKEEYYREKNGKLSAFKSGRRFIYIDKPPHPLPKTFQVSFWRATLYYKGQKEEIEASSPSENQQVDVAPSFVSKQGKIDAFFPAPSPRNSGRSRPEVRTGGGSRTLSSSRTSRQTASQSGERKRRPSQENTGSPLLKRGKNKDQVRGKTAEVDYFEFDNSQTG